MPRRTIGARQAFGPGERASGDRRAAGIRPGRARVERDVREQREGVH
jgi:hypothetical protein